MGLFFAGFLRLFVLASGPTRPPADQLAKRPSYQAVMQQKWLPFAGSYFRLVAVAETGPQPKNVSVAPDGKRVFVTNFGYHDRKNVYRYDPLTLEVVAKAEFPGNAIEAAPSADGKLLWVSNFYHEQFLGLDSDTLAVVRTFKVGKVPKHFAIAPDEKTAYVANWESNSTSVLDFATGAVTSIELGYHPRGTAVTPDGKKVYIVSAQHIHVVDAATREVRKTMKSPFPRPRHAVVTPDGKRALISCFNTRWVIALDTATDEVVAKYEVGNGPKTIDVSADGRFAYTADYRGDSMSVIDLATGAVLVMPLPITRGSGLAVAPDDRRIYVTGWDSYTMAVIERLLPGDRPGPVPPTPAGGVVLAKLVKVPQHDESNDRAEDIAKMLQRGRDPTRPK